MAQTLVQQSEDDAAVELWLRRAPVVRRFLAKIGLPGKLILCFMALLVLGLGGRCFAVLRLNNELMEMLHGCPGANAALHRGAVAMFTCNILAVLVAIPLITLVVYRIFEPIRSLVAAANRIAAGDLETRVAVHRPDAIGDLARAMNQMARRVRQQQRDLENANAKLAEANRQLEEKVQQRTAQLEAANKRLKLEVAEKEDFIRAVSHDLSAPLRNISGMTSMLLHKNRDVFDNEVIHRLERIQKNVEVEAGLISELLELSKIKTTRHRMVEVDLNELVRDIGGTFESDLQTRGIALTIDNRLPTLRCERPRLRQVFQNLIDNAIKYMGEPDSAFAPSPLSRGETEPCAKQIHIGAAVRDSEVEFYVQDTGMGIDEEDLESIFYIFRRGRSSAVRAIPGKGIGLSCVKSIIETYNGNIWVERRLGRGSTFYFTINGKYLAETTELVGTA